MLRRTFVPSLLPVLVTTGCIVDFEEEAAAKITALNVDAELKLFMAHIYDLKYPNKKK